MNLKTSQYKQLIKKYEQTQLKNFHILDSRKKEIYDKIPEIRALDEKIASTSIKLSKLIIANKKNATESILKLKEYNLELSMKKIELLYQHGYRKDYLHPIYTCEKCKDTGFIDTNKCSCFRQALLDIAYEQSNIKASLDKENFDTFSFDYYSKEIDPDYGISPYDHMKRIYDICVSFVNNFENEFTNIILYGSAGVGKTFISNCIAKALLDKGYTVIYLTAFQLFEIFEKNKFNRSNSEVDFDELVSNILTCDLLIIDDLGTEFNTSLTGPQLFNCLNTRLINKMPTIISTNLPPSEWSNQYSNRIYSRIFGIYKPLHIFGEDIRIKKAYH